VKAVFIERDGVICHSRPGRANGRAEFEFLPGARESLAKLATLDIPIIVITDQAIANGEVAPAHIEGLLHQQMVEGIKKAGGRVDRVLYCPSRSDGNGSPRELQPGLLLQASHDMEIDLTQSYLIGDAYTDVQAGQAVGCQCFLVLTGRGHDVLRWYFPHGCRGFCVSSALESAVNSILQQEGCS